VATVGCGTSSARSAAPAASTPSAHHFAGTPTVGALFLPNAYPAFHSCTASVVRSKSRNIIVTAAHCMRKGSDAGYTFVPGYHDGMAPYGTWTTTAGFGSPKWLRQTKTSTRHDWAFLRVANHMSGGTVKRLQQVVGGNRLGTSPKSGRMVRVPGYVLGTADKPITCRAPVYRHASFPAFNCGGYAGGVSGSPWLVGTGKVRTIVGIIGGLHQGGCSPSTSYSSPLGSGARSLLKRATRHQHGDAFPTAPGDGC
jgi:V8-like Glu-specific endopeptidase